MKHHQESQGTSRGTGWGKFLSNAASPSPVEMVPALGGTKLSGDASKAPWGVGSYRQRFVQGLVACVLDMRCPG